MFNAIKKIFFGKPVPEFKKGDWVRIDCPEDAFTHAEMMGGYTYVARVDAYEYDDWLIFIDRGTKKVYEQTIHVTKLTDEEALLARLSQ